MLLAAIPGAVVGGRLLHGLDFLDAYAAQPVALLDLSRGSLSLVGAVVGGALTSAYVCRLLGGKVGVWADASAVALLLVIGLGKLVMLLGGAGQGQAWDGAFAVVFSADRWLVERQRRPYRRTRRSCTRASGCWPVCRWRGGWVVVSRGGAWSGRGLVLLAAVAWWLLGRAFVALTWRDAPVLAGLGMEGLLAIVVLLAVGVLALAVVASTRAQSPRTRGPTQPFGPLMPQSIRG